MKLLKAGTFGFYDIFLGEGWKNHTRIQLKKTGHVVYISGERLAKWQMFQLGEILTKGK